MNVLPANQTWQSKQMVTGWGASLILHAVLALVAVTMAPRMTMIIEQQPFQWDVTLVDPPREVARQETPAPTAQVQPPPPVKPQRQALRPVEPTPQIVTRQVETREAPQPVQRTVEPVQRLQPVQEVVQVQPKPVEPQEIKTQEPIVQETAPAAIVKEATPVVDQAVAYQAPPVVETREAPAPVVNEPVMETREAPSIVAAQPVVESRPEPVAAAEPPAPPAEQAQEAPVVATVAAPPAPVEPVAEPVPAVPQPVAAPAQQEEHQVVARAVPPRATPSKADFAWLAESLHRRIIELRHYPKTARLNGWEGKVVLRVTLKRDGHLEDVQVVKSSGYEALDSAAMEAVRRACPLHMKQELAAPTVVVQVPISYNLGN